MRIIPILTALDASKIERFVPFMLDDKVTAEQVFPNVPQAATSSYKMSSFVEDNKLVMTWFSQLQQRFSQFRDQLTPKREQPVRLEATGSRSFGASYTESDLECAIVSERFDDFLDFCRFLNTHYGNGHNFLAIKTLAGLPLLIIKGDSGFVCPELSKLYPNKTLPQLEVTFRHPQVHDIIQKAGTEFFASLKEEELESYVFNKRQIELFQRAVPDNKKYWEEFKGALSAALKCLPAGKLQDTPDFNKEVFATAVKAKPVSEAVSSGLTFHKPASPRSELTSAAAPTMGASSH